ncbi:unnamed protein product [Dicrocoelium dendriticum]|nr:unnamed protein product [Dicrocoelium dendriticum]CAH8670063.1 unnamed protein product [Dicrocoelium dendriticum]
MLSFLGLGQNVDIRIALHEEERKKQEVKTEDGHVYPLVVYYDGETVAGNVLIGMKRGSRLEHQGIRVDFIGMIEFYSDRGSHDEFISLSQDLARPGILSQPTTYPFEFVNISKPHESYCGTHVRLRYILKVTILRRLTDLTKERELLVHTFTKPHEPDESIQMEVGIEDSLHIEFEYNKSKYHLHDVIVGKIYFLLVRVKIKNMELQIIKRETVGYGLNAFSDSETIAKFEIMDGAPVRGESIPIRLFLQPYALTPTMRDVNRKFSVRFFLNLVLLDEEDRRYYKQQEIILYRRPDRRRKSFQKHSYLNNWSAKGEVSVAEPSKLPQTPEESAYQASNGAETLDKDVFSKENDCEISGTAFRDQETSADVPNQPTVSHSYATDGNHSSSSASPEASRASRSMHRYESKHVRPISNFPPSLDAENPSDLREESLPNSSEDHVSNEPSKPSDDDAD